MSKQIDSESMELLSARFADLIAQEQQSRWLDQIGRLLFTSADKESLIANLASSLTNAPVSDGRFFWLSFLQIFSRFSLSKAAWCPKANP